MKHIKIFEHEPNYVFGSDEAETVLVWPAADEFPDGDNPVHYREHDPSTGERIDYIVFGYAIPNNSEEYAEIIHSAAEDAALMNV